MNTPKTIQDKIRLNLKVKANEADNQAEYAEGVRQSQFELREKLKYAR